MHMLPLLIVKLTQGRLSAHNEEGSVKRRKRRAKEGEDHVWAGHDDNAGHCYGNHGIGPCGMIRRGIEVKTREVTPVEANYYGSANYYGFVCNLRTLFVVTGAEATMNSR